MTPDPYSVVCPHCAAGPGHQCVTVPSRWSTRTHAARWRAVGIENVTLEQWFDASKYLSEHTLRLRLDATRRIRNGL